MLDHLGWNIEAPTKLRMIVANDYKSTSLGKIFNVPVKIAGATIDINMIVVDTTSYEVVLENEFLK